MNANEREWIWKGEVYAIAGAVMEASDEGWVAGCWMCEFAPVIGYNAPILMMGRARFW